jgi:hypothetical protein
MSVPGPFGVVTPSAVFSFCRINDWNCGALGQVGWLQKLWLRGALVDLRIIEALLRSTGQIHSATLYLNLGLGDFAGQGDWAEFNPEQRIDAWSRYLNRRATSSGWGVEVNAQEEYVEFSGVKQEVIKVMRKTGEVFHSKDGGISWRSIIGPYEP